MNRQAIDQRHAEHGGPEQVRHAEVGGLGDDPAEHGADEHRHAADDLRPGEDRFEGAR